MSDQAGAAAYDDAAVMAAAGMFALNMSLAPKRKFAVHEGDRRRFGDRVRGRADLKLVEKENQP